MLITLCLYVLRELSRALGVALLVFSLILLAISAGGVIRDGAGVMTVLTILPKLFPVISRLVLPLTFITGTLVCYARMSANREFMATQAAGVHPMWVAAPALVVAALGATITVFLNADVLTAAMQSVEKSLVSERTEILRRKLARPGSFTFHNVAISRLPRDAQDRMGIDITFFGDTPPVETKEETPPWHPDYPHQEVRIVARNHDLSMQNAEAGALRVQMHLEQLRRHDISGEDVQVLTADTANPHWDLHSDEGQVRVNSKRITFWGIGKLMQHRQMVREELEAVERDRDKAQQQGAEDVSWYAAQIKKLKKNYNKYVTGLHMKLALSFACFSFAVIGIPLGLLIRRESMGIGFAFGLVVALMFYLVMKGLGTLVEDDRIDVWVMWLPNLFLLGLGGFLWYRSRQLT